MSTYLWVLLDMFRKLYFLAVPVAKFSTNSELLAVLSYSPLSPSNLRISIIQQSYCLALTSTELCELVFSWHNFF